MRQVAENIFIGELSDLPETSNKGTIFFAEDTEQTFYYTKDGIPVIKVGSRQELKNGKIINLISNEILKYL